MYLGNIGTLLSELQATTTTTTTGPQQRDLNKIFTIDRKKNCMLNRREDRITMRFFFSFIKTVESQNYGTFAPTYICITAYVHLGFVRIMVVSS